MLFLYPINILSQQICHDTILTDARGVKTSEGKICDGKFHGFWKNFYPNGNVRSEGMFVNGLNDSLWSFYDTAGNIVQQISYKLGVKHGTSRKFTTDFVIEENYVNGLFCCQYFEKYYNGKLHKSIPIENGKFHGTAMVYDSSGQLISIEIYRYGVLILREDINRFDLFHQKHGKWKEFYTDGKLHREIDYYHGKLHGYYKEYDKNGKLIKIERYFMDSLLIEDPSTKKHVILRDYYSNGKVHIEGSYFNGVPDGLRREYDSLGNIIKSYIFDKGSLVFEGIIDFSGKKQGYSYEYEDGKVVAVGKYVNNLKDGLWKFYDNDGHLIEQGFFKKGKPDGIWYAYYPSGKVKKIEHYDDGLLHGDYIEFYEDSTVMVKGVFYDGQENGKWEYHIGDVSCEVNYKYGELHGDFKIFDRYSKELLEINHYSHGVMDGNQLYFQHGQIKLSARFINGKREGVWKYYDNDGNLFLRITYKNDEEIKINNVKLVN